MLPCQKEMGPWIMASSSHDMFIVLPPPQDIMPCPPGTACMQQALTQGLSSKC